MKRHIFSMLMVGLALHFAMPANAQFLRGIVTDQNELPIPGATVVWANTNIGVYADEQGEFEIPLPDTTQQPTWIVASFQNISDTFDIPAYDTYYTLSMSATLEIQEVVVKGERTGSYISTLQPVKTEIINRAELRKAACCDLAGCFETQSTVQPQTTNILTNAKELRILGLSGVYNQVLVDGLPMVQGLTYTYGISTLPGSVVDNIWVTKGANSVLQGYESISGQINVLTLDGEKANPLFANAYVNSFGEKHGNVHLAVEKEKWNSFLALHTVQPAAKIDRDDDNFLDLPLLTRYMALNKWHYGSETADGWSATLGLRFTDERRIGGQEGFDPEKDKGSTAAYGQFVHFRQPELYAKTGYRFDAFQKISFIGSAFRQSQDAWFGVTRYDAAQNNAYANLQYELAWGNTGQHNLKTGASFRHLKVEEVIAFTSDTLPRTFDGQYFREENIPGFFAENTFLLLEKITWITGIRADRHNDFGWYVTPRTLVRYALGNNTDLRASVGTGWRTVNLFPENINLLAGGRDLVFAEALRPEHALNTGVNLVQRWDIKNARFTFSADFYHTRFQNQFFPDYDSDAAKAVIGNFSGKSVSNGLQSELSCQLFQQWELKAAYNYLEVFQVKEGREVALPFNPKHRVLGVVSYQAPSKKWQADMNLHWYGEQRLPNTQHYPAAYRQPSQSKPYSVTSLQYTRTLGQWEVYAGCENLFDFRQKRPIVSWENPFGQYFDTSFAWGPTRGRELYLGVRFSLGTVKE